MSDSPSAAHGKSSGFKIAGIDVLSAGADEREAISSHSQVSRSLGEISRSTQHLFTVFHVVSPAPYFAPRHRRDHSGRDDAYEQLEPSPSASPSPMAMTTNGKRPRGSSQSSPESFIYSPNGHRFASGEAHHVKHELPPFSSISSNESYEPSPYEHAPGRHGPYFGPPAGVQVHSSGSAYPMPPKSPYTPYPDPRRHGHRSEESLGYREMDHYGSQSPQSERMLSRASAPRSLGRLRIPSEQSDDMSSSAAATKLTKTGRVSKALRGEPVHACNICDKVYTRAEHLRRHKHNHGRANTLLVAEARTGKTFDAQT